LVECHGGEAVVVREEVALADAELEVEHVKELALDAPDVTLPEHARAQRPVHILERRIIQILDGTGIPGQP
jgi:hypothetical protein